jgi:AcrR family transcriptional regulator
MPAARALSSSIARQTQAERREKAERAILAAALRIVGTRGIDALTLAEAGEAAGYSRALPAHYFESKDALLAALADFVISRYLRRLDRDAPGGEGLEGLIARITFYIEDGRKDRDVLRSFHAVIGAAPGKAAIAAASARLTEASRRSFAALIRAGIRRGEIRSDVAPEVEAVWILAALRGVMAQWVIAPDKTPIARVRDAFTRNVRRALEA